MRSLRGLIIVAGSLLVAVGSGGELVAAQGPNGELTGLWTGKDSHVHESETTTTSWDGEATIERRGETYTLVYEITKFSQNSDHDSCSSTSVTTGEGTAIPEEYGRLLFLGIATTDITSDCEYYKASDGKAQEVGEHTTVGHLMDGDVIRLDLLPASHFLMQPQVSATINDESNGASGQDAGGLASDDGGGSTENAGDADPDGEGSVQGDAADLDEGGDADSGGDDQSGIGDDGDDVDGGLPVGVLLGGGALVAAGVGAAGIRTRRRGRETRPTDTGSPSTEPADDDDDDERTAVHLELTYPVGASPRVFTHGWLFGARCIADPGGPNQRDVSESVRWSGTGKFAPPVGSSSRPTFNRQGPNTVTLTVEVDGVSHNVNTAVDTVRPSGYARVGDIVEAPADAHGCPACPHSTVGKFIEGSTTVILNDLPAVRVGDGGLHGPCCGPGTLTVIEGDPTVLIDGRPAARKGSRTEHCGGFGEVVSGSPG